MPNPAPAVDNRPEPTGPTSKARAAITRNADVNHDDRFPNRQRQTVSAAWTSQLTPVVTVRASSPGHVASNPVPIEPGGRTAGGA